MNLLKKLTVKNLKLNRKRSIVTIIGIMLSVALITAASTMYESGISSLIDYEVYEYGNFHIVLYDVSLDDIKTLKNNRQIEEIYITTDIGYAKLENSKNENKPYIFVKGFTKEALNNLSVNLIEGRLPENENEIVIPTHLKTNGRVTLNVGDTINLDVGTRVDNFGNILNQKNPYYTDDYSFEVTDSISNKIIETGNGTKSDEQIIDTETKTYTIVGIAERPTYSIESYSAPGYTFITCMNEEDMMDNLSVYIKYTKSGLRNYYETTANILGVNKDLFKSGENGGFKTQEEYNAYVNEMEKVKYDYTTNNYLITLQIEPLKNSTSFNLMATLVVICAIIVLTSVFCIKNSFDISMTEKIKQYGMLKSVGATKKQIRENVFFEGTVLRNNWCSTRYFQWIDCLIRFT